MKRFTVADLTFAAMMAAAIFVSSSLIIGPLMKLRIPGLTHLVFAPVAGFFYVLSMARIAKPGSLLLVACLQSLAYAMISPVISVFVLAGAIGAEIVAAIGFGGTRQARGQLAAAVSYSLISFPVGLAVGLAFMPQMFAYFKNVSPLVFLGFEAGIGLAALLGALAGRKMVAELIRAGRLAEPG